MPRPSITFTGLKLFIVHIHLRPGGVRRVIELAAPAVAAALRPRASEIVLVAGEAPDAKWIERFGAECAGVRVTCAIDSALGYISEQRMISATIRRRIRTHLDRCFGDSDRDEGVVWAHNPGLGRNLLVAAELTRVVEKRGLRMIFHHHDWWFDNRWARWPEMQRTGFRTLAKIAETILPISPSVKHAGINQADVRVMRRYLGKRAGWVPNVAAPGSTPPAERVRAARRWLTNECGDEGPVWLVPCRLLRRKDLAEALLLTRWLRPEAWLVTTGAMSSADERLYASALERAAGRHGWRLRLGVLARAESTKPSVRELLAASETILLTSLQEGFGLPSLEAAAAKRPLIVRTLPNIAPDLARFGFRFPHSYDDVQVDVRLFDRGQETKRQTERWLAWREDLPRACRSLAGKPALLDAKKGARAVPFSRLTLAAQLEVLSYPSEFSWHLCARLNPYLASWRARAAAGKLVPSSWPRDAGKWLSEKAYGTRIATLLYATTGRPLETKASMAAANEFMREKLAGENQYPLLWTSEP